MSSTLTFAQQVTLDVVAGQVPDARVVDWAECASGRGGPVVVFGDGRRFVVSWTGRLVSASGPPSEPLEAVA